MLETRPTPTFLEAMIQEAEAYLSMESIEACVEKGLSLHHIPLQPLYLALKALPAERAASHLAKLSSEQRALLLDLDLWEKDELEVNGFEYWVRTYALSPDDGVRQEFARSPAFGLFLKGRLNIWTFDQEAPHYPEHDCYFLSDDSLLLFEYDEHFNPVAEVQRLMRDLYAELGAEEAYVHLLKYVSEGTLALMEEEYHLKKGRLNDIGLVDYYDALEIDNPFPALTSMERFVRQKAGITPEIGDFGKRQRPDRLALAAYRGQLQALHLELSKIGNAKRRDFLQFNFIRLVNASVALKKGLRDGPMALQAIGKRTCTLLQLGYDYLKHHNAGGADSAFECFDFCQIYKMGNTLIALEQKNIKRALTRTQLQNNEAFLGAKLDRFLDAAFNEVVQLENSLGQLEPITTYTQWKEFHRLSTFLQGILPFADGLYRGLATLTKGDKLNDHFYLNYAVEQLDFEVLMLSSFAHFVLGHYREGPQAIEKLGTNLGEYRRFARQVLDPHFDGKTQIETFGRMFGLGEVPGFVPYFSELLSEHMQGYDFDSLAEEEFRHVGGPIILRTS